MTALPATSRWPDQRRQPDAGQPARGQRRPAVGEVLLPPDVVAAGGQPLVAVRAADVEQPGRVGELEQPGGVGLAHVQLAGQPLLVAHPDPAAAQQPGRLLLEEPSSSPTLPTLSSAAPAARRSTEPCSCVVTAGSGRSRGGPNGASPRRCSPISRGSSTLSASMRASRPRCSSRRAGVRPPSEGVSGRWPTGRSPASRSSTARSSASSSASVGRQVGGQREPQLGRPAAQPRGMADGAAHRVGGAQHVVAPQQRAGGEPLQAGRQRRRRGRRGARRRSRRGPPRRSGPAARRRAPAASRRRARRARGRPTPGRRAGWPGPRRRTARGGRRRAGPPAGRSTARRCGCAARRRASQGGPWASGPRYVVAASNAAASMEGCRAAEDPQTRTALEAYQAGGAALAGRRGDRRRPRGPARGRGRRRSAETAASASRAPASSSSRWS